MAATITYSYTEARARKHFVIEGDTQLECAEKVIDIVKDELPHYWSNHYQMDEQLGVITHCTARLELIL